MSRRKQIQMTDAEIRDFLDQSKTVVLSSIGKGGFPHPMPMWYTVDASGAILMTTFAKSQKVQNLRRDPRVSLLVEAGERYAELRGVVLYGRAELIQETDRVLPILEQVTERIGETRDAPPELVRAGLERSARKRVGIRVKPERIVSWDHRKLAGAY